MLFKIPPYFHREKDIMHKNIFTGKLSFKDSTSRELQDIILRLLERVPENRLGYEYGAKEIKAHPFFANIDWDEIYEKYAETILKNFNFARKHEMPKPKIRSIFKDNDDSEEEVKFSSSSDEDKKKVGGKKKA